VHDQKSLRELALCLAGAAIVPLLSLLVNDGLYLLPPPVGSSSKANNTVRSKPCGPVMTTALHHEMDRQQSIPRIAL